MDIDLSRISFHRLLKELPPLVIPSRAPHAFTLFANLPIELRHKIWKLASFYSRRIKLFSGYQIWLAANHSHHVEGQSKVPAILHTSKEARAEGLRYYSLCLEKTPFAEKHK